MCVMSTQSIKMPQKTMTSLHQASFGNMVHGLNAVLPVGQVSEIS